MTSLSLPIDTLYTEFKASYPSHHLVIESDTGSGKSTRLPLWCAEPDVQGKRPRVLVVEPRRVACLALAEYVQGLTDLKVGYAIRFDCTVTLDTQIAFVTPGIALRWLSGDMAGLGEFDTLMIDEFHERRWDTDLLLALLKHRDRHRLLLTSATLSGEVLCNYLSDNKHVNAVCLQAQGKRFHVELRYLASESHHLPDIRGLEERLVVALTQALQDTQGDILVFLPGKREITAAIHKCRGPLAELDERISLLALHGSIGAEEQVQVLRASSNRRVIFATNIAETSLTIPGITGVIDSGLERRTHQRNGRTVLSLSHISKASSKQRMGRAGRTQPGLCIRLWGKAAPLLAATPPELQREELVEPMLAAACAGAELAQLDFVDPLPAKSLEKASAKLMLIGALDQLGRVTSHGQRLFPLPIDTQFAHLISVMPDGDCLDLMIDLAAALTTPGQFYRLPKDEAERLTLLQWEPFGCDAYTLIKLLRCHDDEIPLVEINLQAIEEARRLAKQIRAALECPSLPKADLSDPLLRRTWAIAVMQALPELAFICRLKRDNALGNGISEVLIGRESRFHLPQDGVTLPVAALVFDQHATPGRGVKQTLNLALCMVPVDKSWLLAAGLGQDRVTEQLSLDEVCVERVYAGRVLEVRSERVEPKNVIQAMITSIAEGLVFPGIAEVVRQDIDAWNIWVKLGGYEEAKAAGICLTSPDLVVFEEFLAHRLSTLGVESIADFELIEAEDLQFEGIPDWLRQEFDQAYPREVILSDLRMSVSYQVKGRWVELTYLSGQRKSGPKRWELPRWQGWRVRYKKASRVIDIV
ncbi:helicase-related protein [Shewanella marisflavi]|uniref:DEAD/DEAH box helicase n=1 Tax=Shewanella marisflavi TaxID=260364 RepID=A0AAC9XPW7_9GAMM|nr:helicase-related protein [Shewanella marisflavi]ASJ98511.1 DEAD/DEAH box helicase [Shewanella marisflavi]